MAAKQNLEAQNPLILRCNRLIEAFAKSDDERDFYLDRLEGFIIYVDLDKGEDELRILEKELEKNKDRYCLIPKLTFYETKKIMEGFINEKVYDIDTKEKLLDIIQSKEARENFLEFIYDHHSELEKWQTFYQERSRIRIIEWLRTNHFHFVFEEDLEFPRLILEKLKKELFQVKVGKDTLNARKTLVAKSKTYYSNEALNPRPKRGRPPKQAQKAEIEPQVTTDIFLTVPNNIRSFLFLPDVTASTASPFSSKFGHEIDLFSSKRSSLVDTDLTMESLNTKLAALRQLSSKWKESEDLKKKPSSSPYTVKEEEIDFDEEDEEEDEGFVPRLNGMKPQAAHSKSAKTSKIQEKISSGKMRHLQSTEKTTPSSKLSKPTKIAGKGKVTPSGKLKAKMKADEASLPKSKKKLKPKLKSISKTTPPPKKVPVKKLKTLRPMKKLKKKK